MGLIWSSTLINLFVGYISPPSMGFSSFATILFPSQAELDIIHLWAPFIYGSHLFMDTIFFLHRPNWKLFISGHHSSMVTVLLPSQAEL